MKKAKLILGGVAVLSMCLLASCSLGEDERIVLRSDGKYEVECNYGVMGWVEMGGPYDTIEEARAKVAYWQKWDEDYERNKAMKRTVVE